MGLYDIVYNFIYGQIFNSSALSSYSTTILGVSTDLNVWLSHTTTIIFFGVLLVCVWCFLKWLFRVVSGLFLLK